MKSEADFQVSYWGLVFGVFSIGLQAILLAAVLLKG